MKLVDGDYQLLLQLQSAVFDLTGELTDDEHDELTELERNINDKDSDWVFLQECELKNRIIDEGRYNGIKAEYKL